MSKPIHVQQTGPPPQALSQREFILKLLRDAGNAGINREHFLSGTGPCGGRKITQVGARLDELEEEGFVFQSWRKHEGDLFVTYRLVSEPIVRKERPAFRQKKRKAGAHQTLNPAPITQQPPGNVRQSPAPDSQSELFGAQPQPWRDPEEGR